MKKVLALLLALIMTVALAACGGTPSDSGNTPPANSTTPAPTPPATPALTDGHN